MKTFFTVLKYFTLEKFDGEYIELMPGLRITNNKLLIERLLTDNFQRIIGILETNDIRDCDVLCYYEYTKEDLEIFKGLPNLNALEIIVLWIDDILKNLWLLKDNCILTDTAYLISNTDTNVEASSVKLGYVLTSSNNQFNKTSFTEVEIEEFKLLHNKIETYLHAKKSGSTQFMLEKNFSRFSRSLLFVKQAREARNLAYKISNYCSSLETLFSTDSNELSHKLSERIAFCLKNELNLLDTFKTIKIAYGIRSRLTHGDVLSAKQIDQLESLSIKIDNILRLLLNKILSETSLFEIIESKKNEAIDNYFEELIFNNEN